MSRTAVDFYRIVIVTEATDARNLSTVLRRLRWIRGTSTSQLRRSTVPPPRHPSKQLTNIKCGL